MSSDDNSETDLVNETTTPISEWPISVEEIFTSINTCKNIRKQADLSSKRPSSCLKKGEGSSKRKRHGNYIVEEELTITAKIAKWWRQKRLQGNVQIIPKCGPNSMIHHISRLPECQSFLQKEKKKLLLMSEMSDKKADKFASLASLEDYLANFNSALNYIDQALHIQPNCPEYLWLKEKLSRQCQVLRKQNNALRTIDENHLQFPSMNEVSRISGKDLSVADFKKNYLMVHKPVIITDVVVEMTNDPFDYSLVLKHAGKTTVTTKEEVSESLTWARLENKRDTSIAALIQGVQTGTVKDVLFDWSLPIHCPSLAEQISLPRYFTDNFLLQTAPESLYRESWPSLFIAPKGATTQLHVDAFHSHFWMALFQGEKRWTFFDEKDTPFLYPEWFQSMDPVFQVDPSQPNLKRFPLFALTRPQQCVLQKDELLFVPAGSPHFVENLTPSLAISSNYVDHSNFNKVCEELKINAFQDERAGDLLSQLQDPMFQHKVQNQDGNKDTSNSKL